MGKIIVQQAKAHPNIRPQMLHNEGEPIDFLPDYRIDCELDVILYEVTCDICGKKWHFVTIDDCAALNGTCQVWDREKDEWIYSCNDCNKKRWEATQ